MDTEQPSAVEAIAAVAPVGTISVTPATPEPEATTPTQATVPPVVVSPVPEPATRPRILPRLFSSSRRSALTPSQSNDDSAQGASSAPSSRPASRGDNSTSSKSRRPKFGRSRTGKESAYNFGGEKDVIGIVLLEVNKAEDLPKLKNSKLIELFFDRWLTSRSDENRMGHGSIYGCLLFKKGFPYSCSPPQLEPDLGRETLVPRETL